MKTITFVGMGSLAAVAAVALAGLAFVGSGVYDIGADDHHTRPVLALIEQLRNRSIERRARSIIVPHLDDPRDIRAGAARYATLCAGCHLAPAAAATDLRRGLYPHPPNLAQADGADPRRTFWVIQHGIKMSAMPAWGKSLDEASIWDIVAFVRLLPNLSPQAYQQLTAAPSASP